MSTEAQPLPVDDAAEGAFAASWRLVATDLDGTIVPRERPVSARTLAAFASCAAAGIPVVPVTGRPPRWVTPLAREAGLAGQVVCANGAVVYDLDADRVVRRHALDVEVVLEVVQRLRPRLPGIGFALEAVTGFRREERYATTFDTGLEHGVGPLEEQLADSPPVVKVLAKCPGVSSDEMLEVARDAVGDLVGVTHSNAVDSLIEVMAPGVSKASTLAEVARGRGVGPEGVVAFGDMPNDLEMLRWAGRSYAVADGHPDAVAAADGVAGACGDDGVAVVLERLLTRRAG
ncbi:Cof-type HAD-IIB family hydrolase [Kineococcus sp. TRM81007]|uniref:HAD family hydrolase n=1 Tax=Kineococcus sp. TRM81007 TaxID=2925831 RepID=UPI001F588212|nr:HAD family hydrolase [Kineococcus sp. TRM81007]MCI2237954.1 Cof-type HAD-IIB family hydrolase [Kineococcus sp. TRM81007]